MGRRGPEPKLLILTTEPLGVVGVCALDRRRARGVPSRDPAHSRGVLLRQACCPPGRKRGGGCQKGVWDEGGQTRGEGSQRAPEEEEGGRLVFCSCTHSTSRPCLQRQLRPRSGGPPAAARPRCPMGGSTARSDQRAAQPLPAERHPRRCLFQIASREGEVCCHDPSPFPQAFYGGDRKGPDENKGQ